MNNRRSLAVLLAALLSLGGTLLHAQVPHSNHVIIVMEENHSYEDVFNSASMPWLTGMAKQYTFLQYSYANAHYSLPNYMWLTAGQAVTFNDRTTSKFNVNNIVRSLLVGGKTWKEYAESLPYSGYTGGTTGYYVEGHDPFSYFTDVVNSSQKYNIVPFSHFSQDLAAHNLPDFAFVTPNGLHDGHNASLGAADTWLKTYIAPVLNTAPFQLGGDGILIITFDESHDTDCRPNASCGPLPGNVGGGRIATVIIGPQIKRGYRSTTKYMEQNVLRTILDLFGITGGPGASATAKPMTDIFR